MWIKNFMPGSRIVSYAPEGEGTGGDTGGGEGADGGENDADNGGDEGGDDQSTGSPDAILTGVPADEAEGGSSDDASDDGDDNSEGDDGGDGGEDDNEADDVVPEGEYEFTMPDGVELDSTMAEKMSPVMKELGITQGQANALAGALSEHISTVATEQADAFVATVQEWTDTAKADKELGGSDENWAKTTGMANAVIQKVGTPEFVQMMSDTGVSNNPEMIRFVLRVAKTLGDDNLDPGENNVDTSDTPTEVTWYGGTTPTTKKG